MTHSPFEYYQPIYHTTMQIFWLVFGGWVAMMISYVHGIIGEIFMQMFRVRYSTLAVTPRTNYYRRILQSSWGLGRTFVFREGFTFRYGTFISLRYMSVGYVTRDDHIKYTMHIWSLSEARHNKLMHTDINSTHISLFHAPHLQEPIYVRIPSKMLPWQTEVVNMITKRTNTPPFPCIAVLITGAAGCGKSTLAKIMYGQTDDMSRMVVIHPANLNNVVIGLGAWSTKRSIILVDEIDVLYQGVANKVRAFPVDKAQYNEWLDTMHEGLQGNTIIMTSNNSYDELISILGKDANSMLRPGRIDLVVDVRKDNNGEFYATPIDHGKQLNLAAG